MINHLSLRDAVLLARDAGVDPADLNPIWGPYLPERDHPISAPPAATSADVHLVIQALTAPAVLAFSVTSAGSTQEIRIACSEDAAVSIAGPPNAGACWELIPAQEVMARLSALLPSSGRLAAAATMTTVADDQALAFTADQQQSIAHSLRTGATVTDALDALDEVDPRLRDAMLSTADRAILAVSMINTTPSPGDAARMAMVRRWNAGNLSLYRSDSARLVDGVHPVPDGDVLGTLIPIAAEATRIGAGRAAA